MTVRIETTPDPLMVERGYKQGLRAVDLIANLRFSFDCSFSLKWQMAFAGLLSEFSSSLGSIHDVARNVSTYVYKIGTLRIKMRSAAFFFYVEAF